MLPDVYAAVDSVYRSEWGRILATLIRLFGDFDIAEEAAQEVILYLEAEGYIGGPGVKAACRCSS